MTDLPNLAIVMVTYKRTREAVITVKSAAENLDYPREKRGWYIADDGSEADHVGAILRELTEVQGETLWGHHSEKFSPGTPFCGRGWNTALQKAHQYAEIILWLEDDWLLNRRLDIAPYVRLLMEREDVGMVRLGGLAVGSDVHIVGHAGVHYLKYLRTTQYAYSGNPLLRHLRFGRAYGPFAEDRNPGDIELDFDGRFRAMSGPDIWRPADIPGWGIFGHIGTDKTW
jgi:hypothetical protein